MPKGHKRRQSPTAAESAPPTPGAKRSPGSPADAAAPFLNGDGILDRDIADLIGRVIDAVQSQQLPAEQALLAAMQGLTAVQESALDLLLQTTKAQAAVVQEWLLGSDAAPTGPIHDRLASAAQRNPEMVESLANGLTGLFHCATEFAREVAPVILGETSERRRGQVEQPSPGTVHHPTAPIPGAAGAPVAEEASQNATRAGTGKTMDGNGRASRAQGKAEDESRLASGQASDRPARYQPQSSRAADPPSSSSVAPNAVTAAKLSEPIAETDTRSTQARPASEAPPASPSAVLEQILVALAQGYSDGRSGSAVANQIRTLYPAAVPGMQRYLAMDDFLVLLWMRHQPALAPLVQQQEFPPFYAAFKAAMR